MAPGGEGLEDVVARMRGVGHVLSPLLPGLEYKLWRGGRLHPMIPLSFWVADPTWMVMENARTQRGPCKTGLNWGIIVCGRSKMLCRLSCCICSVGAGLPLEVLGDGHAQELE